MQRSERGDGEDGERWRDGRAMGRDGGKGVGEGKSDTVKEKVEEVREGDWDLLELS
jgi:hypothetical protein